MSLSKLTTLHSRAHSAPDDQAGQSTTQTGAQQAATPAAEAPQYVTAEQLKSVQDGMAGMIRGLLSKLEGKLGSGQQTTAPPATSDAAQTTQIPPTTSPDTAAQLKRLLQKEAFSDSIAGYQVTPAQRGVLFSQYQASDPADPGAWVQSMADAFGFAAAGQQAQTQQQTQASSAQAQSTATPPPQVGTAVATTQEKDMSNVMNWQRPTDLTDPMSSPDFAAWFHANAKEPHAGPMAMVNKPTLQKFRQMVTAQLRGVSFELLDRR